MNICTSPLPTTLEEYEALKLFWRGEGYEARGVENAEIVGALLHWWRLSLVIESAVRRAGETVNHTDVLAAIYRTQELVKSTALSTSNDSGGK